MISTDVFAHTVRLSGQSRDSKSRLSRLFAAAVVNRQFREALLNDPHRALLNGYPGQVDQLSQEERDLITSVRARSLPELAQKVNRLMRSQAWA